MLEPSKNDKKVETKVNEDEASYLQSLGLKTLLGQRFTKPVTTILARFTQRKFSKAWPSLTLFFVLLFALSAIVLTLSANAPKVAGKCETCSNRATGKEAREPKPGRNQISGVYSSIESSVSKKIRRISAVTLEGLNEFFAKASPTDLKGRHPINGETLAHLLMKTQPDVALIKAFREAGGSLNQHRFSFHDGTWGKFQKGDTPLMLCLRRGDINTSLILLQNFSAKEIGLWQKNYAERDALFIFLYQRKKLKSNGASDDDMTLMNNLFTASSN